VPLAIDIKRCPDGPVSVASLYEYVYEVIVHGIRVSPSFSVKLQVKEVEMVPPVVQGVVLAS